MSRRRRGREAGAPGHARARLAVALAARRPLVPLTALVFAVVGVFADLRNEVRPGWAVTSMLGFVLAARLVAAVERETPDPADAMLTVAAGGPQAAWHGRLIVVGLVAATVTVPFLAYPVAIGAFDPPPRVADVALAGSVHLASASAGGALAMALARPVPAAAAFAAIVIALCATLALAPVLGPLAGPGGAGWRMRMRRGASSPPRCGRRSG